MVLALTSPAGEPLRSTGSTGSTDHSRALAVRTAN
jgi:hypothetical protein